MKYFDWDNDKNEWLMRQRGISFELIQECIEKGRVLADIQNHQPYTHQRVFIVEIDGYCFEVPYVEDDEKIFLKTAHASHEATKKYLKKQP
jgi:uncharacterized DUF497 family protein